MPPKQQLGCKKGRVQGNADHWILSNPRGDIKTRPRNISSLSHPKKNLL